LHLASGYNPVFCLFRAPWLAETTVWGPAALGQLVNAAVVHLDIYMAALDLVLKLTPVLHKALVHHEPQDLAAAAIQVCL
jgi:hypothetical protein